MSATTCSACFWCPVMLPAARMPVLTPAKSVGSSAKTGTLAASSASMTDFWMPPAAKTMSGLSAMIFSTLNDLAEKPPTISRPCAASGG